MDSRLRGNDREMRVARMASAGQSVRGTRTLPCATNVAPFDGSPFAEGRLPTEEGRHFKRTTASLRDTDDLRLRELLKAFLTELAAEARLLRAAERTLGRHLEMLVHPHGAGA